MVLIPQKNPLKNVERVVRNRLVFGSDRVKNNPILSAINPPPKTITSQVFTREVKISGKITAKMTCKKQITFKQMAILEKRLEIFFPSSILIFFIFYLSFTAVFFATTFLMIFLLG